MHRHGGRRCDIRCGGRDRGNRDAISIDGNSLPGLLGKLIACPIPPPEFVVDKPLRFFAGHHFSRRLYLPNAFQERNKGNGSKGVPRVASAGSFNQRSSTVA